MPIFFSIFFLCFTYILIFLFLTLLATYTQNKKRPIPPQLFSRRSLQIELANCRSLGTGRHNSLHHNKKKKMLEREFSLLRKLYRGEWSASLCS